MKQFITQSILITFLAIVPFLHTHLFSTEIDIAAINLTDFNNERLEAPQSYEAIRATIAIKKPSRWMLALRKCGDILICCALRVKKIMRAV